MVSFCTLLELFTYDWRWLECRSINVSEYEYYAVLIKQQCFSHFVVILELHCLILWQAYCTTHDDDSATLCKNLAKIGPVASEFKKGVCGIFAATLLQFDDRPTFGTLAFWDELEHCDYSGLISNDFCTLCRNFVRFGSVTPEFKAKEVVRPASIIVATLSSPMFAMVQSCYAL